MMDEMKEKPLKVVNSSRTRKVGVMVKTYQDLITKCQLKFETSENITITLEEDGTEIDEEYYISIRDDTSLMLLEEGETWTDKGCHGNSTDQSSSDDRVIGFLQELRKKRRMETSTAVIGKKKNTTITAHVGWQNYSFSDRKFKIVKASKDHPDSGPRLQQFNSEATMREIEAELKKTFFPMKKSPVGHQKRFQFFVGNYLNEMIDQSMTLNSYSSGMTRARLYLHSKQINSVSALLDSTSSSESDIDLPEINFNFPKNRPAAATPTATVTSPESVLMIPNTPAMEPTSNMLDFPGWSQQIAQGPSTHREAGTPTVSIRMPEDPRTCAVCYDRGRDTILIPCCHSVCHPCGVHLKENAQLCPFCRSNIEKAASVNV